MNWKGKKLNTYGDVMNAVQGCATQEEAKEFMRLYEAENPHAKDNVGYMAGYFDNDTKYRIFDWFGVTHPIFGNTDPTFNEALLAGIKMGRADKQPVDPEKGDGPCACCGEPGKLTQGPWPLPKSECYCNDCFDLEGIAFNVWRELNPTIHKSAAPIPFLKSKADWPPNAYAMTGEEVKTWFKEKMRCN